MTTMLYLMQTNIDQGIEDKEVETNYTLYGFLADDWLFLLLENLMNHCKFLYLCGYVFVIIIKFLNYTFSLQSLLVFVFGLVVGLIFI